MIIVVGLLTGKKYKLKADNKYRNFPTQLFLGQISTKFGESEEVL